MAVPQTNNPKGSPGSAGAPFFRAEKKSAQNINNCFPGEKTALHLRVLPLIKKQPSLGWLLFKETLYFTTRTMHLSVWLPTFATTLVVPADTPLTTPSLLMVATAGFSEDQVTVAEVPLEG